MYQPSPRSLRDPSLIAERRLLLQSEVRSRPLVAWHESLSRRRSALVPFLDPAEGGVETETLVLLEAPGPMTNEENKRPGSGFISVDNDDRTAEMSWHLRNDAGLHSRVLHWNVVPWYLGVASRKPTQRELAQGAMELRGLLALLPQLRVVIACGLFAQKGWRQHVEPYVSNSPTVIETWHPSPLATKQPGKHDDLVRAFERAARLVR